MTRQKLENLLIIKKFKGWKKGEEDQEKKIPQRADQIALKRKIFELIGNAKDRTS